MTLRPAKIGLGFRWARHTRGGYEVIHGKLFKVRQDTERSDKTQRSSFQHHLNFTIKQHYVVIQLGHSFGHDRSALPSSSYNVCVLRIL